MDKRKIARHALSFMGGNPNVFAYYNDDSSKSIDIMTCSPDDSSDIISLATIGLSYIEINKTYNGSQLRVEIIMAKKNSSEELENVLATVAFSIQDNHYCNFGTVLYNVMTPYIKSNLRHVVLMHPTFWPNYEPLELDDSIITWLLAVPITEKEEKYISKFGIDNFDRLMENNKVDITDFSRHSCV